MAEFDEEAHPRDDKGRFGSGGGGGDKGPSAKDWAGSQGAKGGGSSAGADAKKWAKGEKAAKKTEAKTATSAAKLASVGADARAHTQPDRHEGGRMHQKAAELHEKAAAAHEAAGNTKGQEYHEKQAERHRESASSLHHDAATRQAEAVEHAGGKDHLEGKREWVGKQVHPDKMEFEGQFAGNGKQTIDDHFHKGKDGSMRPTTARAEFHEREIIGPAFEGKKTAKELGQEKPVAILTMGGPASGKGVVLKKLEKHGLDTKTFVHVDPDEVKGKLPEYQAQVPKGTFSKTPDGKEKFEGAGKTFVGAAAQVHEESSYVAKQIRDKAIAGGHNVVIDGTGGNPKKFIELMQHLEKKGYDVQVHHPHLDVDEGVKRALDRATKSGRHVPEPFIRQTYDAIAKAEKEIIAAAPNYTRYDANNGHVPIESRKKGK